MRILLIEDDVATAAYISDALAGQGHAVDVIADGRAGLARASQGGFDVLVIDRMLPGCDGLSIVHALRTEGIGTPIIFLTAVGGVADRIEGLKAGADDYLVKPFELGELEARVDALGRRPPLPNSKTVLKARSVELDRLARRVAVATAPVELTGSEFSMLELLLLNCGHPVTKAMLLESVFDLDSPTPAAIIEPHISRLRAKLERAGASGLIRTVRGVGYIVVED